MSPLPLLPCFCPIICHWFWSKNILASQNFDHQAKIAKVWTRYLDTLFVHATLFFVNKQLRSSLSTESCLIFLLFSIVIENNSLLYSIVIYKELSTELLIDQLLIEKKGVFESIKLRGGKNESTIFGMLLSTFYTIENPRRTKNKIRHFIFWNRLIWKWQYVIICE